MSEANPRSHRDPVTVHVSAEALYALVSDISRTGEWSPVCTSCWWDDDADAGQVGYFDGAVLVQRATAPALFSVALMDQTCPPSTVFAAYNGYAGEKDIVVYEFNDHEGGGSFQQLKQLEWLRGLIDGLPLEEPGSDDRRTG